MNIIHTRSIGRTSAQISELGLGCAPLGDLFVALSEAQAQATLQGAWDAGVRYYDTSPFYGYGKSEHRLGTFLRQQPRNEFMLSTKVGRVFHAARNWQNFDPGAFVGGLPFEFDVDYSYDGIMRSVEDSLLRLSLPSIDFLVIHDLDLYFYKTEARVNAWMNQLYTSGWRALDELKRTGFIKGVGAGINELGLIPKFLDLVDLDFVLVAYGYNLLKQDMLDHDFPRCQQHGVNVIVGAVFASGILASGAVPGAKFFYADADEEILGKTRRIEALCQRYNVPLRAAAMQFLLANPLVSAIIPGAIAPEHVQSNVEMLRYSIPAAFWAEMKGEGLLREDAPTP